MSDDWKTLTEELEELERTDPAVAEAARRYDEMSRRIRRGFPLRRRKAQT